MTRLCWIGIAGGLLLALSGTPAAAQSSADAFFHDAAQRYVTGDLEAARRAVERGLEVAPSDPRLRALREKLKRKEKRRGGGQASRQGPQGRRQRPQSRGEDAQERRSRESGEARPQADASSDRSSGRRQAPQSPRAGQEPHDTRGRRGGAQRRTALSRAQAARLLQALENQEMKLLREVQARPRTTQQVEKDW